MAGMDLGALFSLMQGVDKEAAASDPWAPLSNYGDQLGNIFLQSAARSGGDDIGGALLGGLGAGLFGGVFKGMGQDYRANQHKLALDSLQSVLSGGSVLQPEGMDSGVFQTMRGAGDLFNLQRKLDKEDLNQKVLAQVAADPAKAEAMRQLTGIDALGELGMRPAVANKPVADQTGSVLSGDLSSVFSDPLNPNIGNYEKLAGDVAGMPLNGAPSLANFGTLLQQHGIDPSMQYTAPVEARQLLQQAIAQEAKNKITPKNAADLASGNVLLGQIQALKPVIDKMGGTEYGDSIFGAAGRTIRSGSLDTPEGDYQNRVNQIAGQLTKKFEGRTSWPAIEQLLGVLTVRQVGSREALKGVVDRLANILQNEQENKAVGFGEGGQALLEQIQGGAPSATPNPAAGAAAMPTPMPAASAPPPPGAVPTGRTFQGKPVYSVNGQLWVP